jgi:hypothetical protein
MQGSRGGTGDTDLPSDARLPMVTIMLPNAAGVQFRPSDFAVDDQPQPMRYEVSSAEQTPLGWRLTASIAAA